jgi:hypothetical protein
MKKTKRNRGKLNKAKTSKEYDKLLHVHRYGYYYDWGWNFNHGDVENHKWRSYRTWKHSRRTQWKE